MNLAEYTKYDALGLAELVAKKQVSPKELTETAVKAIEAANPTVKAVVELYPDRIKGSTKSPWVMAPSAACRSSSRTCSATSRGAESSSAAGSARA